MSLSRSERPVRSRPVSVKLNERFPRIRGACADSSRLRFCPLDCQEEGEDVEEGRVGGRITIGGGYALDSGILEWTSAG